MTESDKYAAVGLILRINGYLLTLTLLLFFALALLAAWLHAEAGASIWVMLVLAAAGLALVASAYLTMGALARLSGRGYCGFWNHGDAVRVMYLQGMVVMAVSLIAAFAVWLT